MTFDDSNAAAEELAHVPCAGHVRRMPLRVSRGRPQSLEQDLAAGIPPIFSRKDFSP